MSGLILPAWLSTQPQYAAVIDSKNPLCNGLRYVVSGAEPSINLVDRKAKASTTGSGLVMASGPSGKKVTAGASNGAHAWNGINAGSKFTVAMVARDTVSGAYRMPLAVIDGGANNVFMLRYGNPNDFEFRVYDNVGNDSAFISFGTVSSTQTSVIVGTVDAGRALSLYYNGRLQSSVAAAAVTANPMLATQNVRLGSNNGEDFGGEIYLALIWARTLSANEVKAFSLNPWQVLKAPTRRLYIGASAATSYTLTAGQGSYSLTGQAAGLRVARTMAAAQGSYSLTGQSATLKATRLLTAAQGSFALTGQAATLKATRAMAAAQGSFTLNGQSATLKATRLLTAAQGSYTLNGRDAALTYSGAGNKSIAAGQGAFALTGQNATLKATRKIVAAQGSYTLNGQSATLTYSGASASYTLAAGYGSFTLTGFDALFTIITPVFPDSPTRTRTARVNTGRIGYASDAVNTGRLGYQTDLVPTRRLGARTK